MNFPSTDLAVMYGLKETGRSTGLFGEGFVVYETPSRSYKLFWYDTGFCTFDKKRLTPGPRQKNWFNLPETHENLFMGNISTMAELFTMLAANLVPTLEDTIAIGFASVNAHITYEINAAAELTKAAIVARTRRALHWSQDTAWLLERLHAYYYQGKLGHEVYLEAIAMSCRRPASLHGERGSQRRELMYVEDHKYVLDYPAPNTGRFFIYQTMPGVAGRVLANFNNPKD